MSDRGYFENKAPDRPPVQKQPHASEDVRVRQGRLPRWLIPVFAGIGLLALGAIGAWFALSMQKPAATASAAGQAKTEQPDNVFWQQAQKAGALKCSRTFSELGGKLTLGSSYSVQANWRKDAGDNHALQAIAGLAYNQRDSKLQAAGVVFAAPVNGQCEGNAVRIVPVAQTCTQVSQSRLIQNSTAKPQDLSGVPVYEYAANGDRVALIPAPGNICIIVSVLRADG